MKNIFQLLFFLFCLSAKAQQQFQLLYHPFPSQQAACMKHAIGGGYLLASNFTDSLGEEGILITRFDNLLNILWEKTISEIGVIESANSFTQDSLGNIYVVGSIYLNNVPNALVIKTDSLCNIFWSKYYSYSSFRSSANRILISDSGQLYISGNSEDIYFAPTVTSPLILKLDSLGNLMWATTKPFINRNTYSINLSKGAGDTFVYAVYGGSMHISGGLSSVDTSGNLLWDNRINLDGTNPIPSGILFDFCNTPSGGYLLTGFEGIDTSYLARNFIYTTDGFGNYLQLIRFGIYYNNTINFLYKTTVIPTADAGYAIAGNSLYPSSEKKIVLVKVDSNFTIQWCRLYETDSIGSYSICVLTTTDLGYLIVGERNGKICLIKTDSMGFSNCNDLSLSGYSIPDASFSSSIMDTHSPVFSLANGSQLSTLHLPRNLDTLCLMNVVVQQIQGSRTLSISPNPARSMFTLENVQSEIKEIEIFNLMGENIYSAAANSEHYTVNCEQWPDGIYFVVAVDENGNKITEIISVMR